MLALDIRQLTYFKEIVDQGSVSKAAAKLHMAQPPLSMLLKELESGYGVPLIKRYREKWEVTEAGKTLYQHAVQMIHDMEMLDVKMRYLKEGDIGRLRVGVSSSCLHLTGKLVKEFSVRYPKIQLQLTKADSEKLERMLYANELDVAIILEPNHSAIYDFIKLAPRPFALAIPFNWQEQIKLDDFSLTWLEKVPFVSLEAMEGYSMLESIMNYLEHKSVHLNIVAKTKDITMAQYLVGQEVGVSILPLVDEDHQFRMHYLQLPELPTVVQPLVLYKKEAKQSLICQKFIQLVEELKENL